jgi:hypothetical protein
MGAFDDVIDPKRLRVEQERSHRADSIAAMRVCAARLESVLMDFYAKVQEFGIPPVVSLDERDQTLCPVATGRGLVVGWPIVWATTELAGEHSYSYSAVGWLFADGQTAVSHPGTRTRSHFTLLGRSKEEYSVQLLEVERAPRIALLSRVATTDQQWPFELGLATYLSGGSQHRGTAPHSGILDYELIEAYRSSGA